MYSKALPVSLMYVAITAPVLAQDIPTYEPSFKPPTAEDRLNHSLRTPDPPSPPSTYERLESGFKDFKDHAPVYIDRNEQGTWHGGYQKKFP
jgi:hypothetical protein